MNPRKKIIHVVGARPNFMKMAPILRQTARFPDQFEDVLVHTGQHYDERMSQVFLDELDLPHPDISLGIGSGTHAEQTARIMVEFEKVLIREEPDLVLVVGDVNSTVACALTSAKLGVRVAHVEAGLRSFDRSMPEEVNRVVTDQLSDLLFTTEKSAHQNLTAEGIPADRIHFVGNVMIDSLARLLPAATERWPALSNALQLGDQPFILVTVHRPSNVDLEQPLHEVLGALSELSHSARVIFPVHPRTRHRIAGIGSFQGNGRLGLLEPLGYLDFLSLMSRAAVVLTDSGGIQEETTYLGIPCLTIRPNTERPVTLEQGTNRLVPTETASIVDATRKALDQPRRRQAPPEKWDGAAAVRIVEVLADKT